MPSFSKNWVIHLSREFSTRKIPYYGKIFNERILSKIYILLESSMGGYELIIIQPILKYLSCLKFLLGTTNRKKFVTNKNPNLMVMSKTVLLGITSRFTRRWLGKCNFFHECQVRYFDFDQNRLWGDTSLWGSTRGLFVLLYDEIKIMKTY